MDLRKGGKYITAGLKLTVGHLLGEKFSLMSFHRKFGIFLEKELGKWANFPGVTQFLVIFMTLSLFLFSSFLLRGT